MELKKNNELDITAPLPFNEKSRSSFPERLL
jgi:hypothetical protein